MTHHIESRSTEITDQLLIKSPFVQQIPITAQKTVIFHALWGNPLKCSKETSLFLDLFKKPIIPSFFTDRIINTNDIVAIFRSRGMLISPGTDERKILSEMRQKVIGSISERMPFRNLYFSITNSCNFSCSYCIMHKMHMDRPKRYLSWEQIKPTIDHFMMESIDLGRDSLNLGITGGEPLLNWRLVNRIIHYTLEKYGKKIQIEITLKSNLSLVNEEIAHVLSKGDLNCCVSLDGWEQIHNQTRRFTDGSGTFRELLKKIQMLRAKGVSINQAYMVLTDSNLHLDEKELMAFFSDLEVNQVTIQPDLVSTTEVSPEKVVDKLLDLNRFSEANGIRISGVWKHPFSILQDRRKPANGPAFCSSLRGQSIVILSDNQISACSSIADNFNLASCFKDFWKKSHYTHFVESNLAGNISECFGCSLEGICMGGCRVTREYAKRTGRDHIFKYHCAIYQGVTKGLVRQKLLSFNEGRTGLTGDVA